MFDQRYVCDLRGHGSLSSLPARWALANDTGAGTGNVHPVSRRARA